LFLLGILQFLADALQLLRLAACLLLHLYVMEGLTHVGLCLAHSLLAFGLLGLYLAAVVTRTVLEPRLVGKQLGLDPLVTLVALYMGFRLFGIGGMILSPLIAVAVTQLAQTKE
jgi:predicted PurR-regulated permease PerM